ncbi:hypothetical protein F4808DRAFT_469896 [Astrocystis sublimbata]|nr:hypothetical protein F4808DRAFT_469896 [Astrocystis sublimbata]
MVHCLLITIATLLASVKGLPLNINLGAYSPALVVGDGEISFSGGEDVSNLMNALEGAAVNSAAATSGATNGAAEDVQALDASSAPTPVEGTEVAQETETAAVDPNLQEQAAQIATLQGMGKEISPREEAGDSTPKRDIQGFDRALNYAEAALTKGPLVELGTGEDGSGVGIIVDNRPNAGAESGEAKAKRGGGSQPRRSTKVTRMYVQRGIPATIQNLPDSKARSVVSLPTIDVPALPKRDSSDAIDAINLNLPADEGVTMTFVESADDDVAQEVIAPA